MKKLYGKIFTLIVLLLGLNAGLQAQNGWAQLNPPLGTDTLIGQVQFITVNEGWVKTGNGGLIHTTDGGTTWTRVYPFPNDSLYNGSDFAMGMSWGSQTHGYTLNSVGDINDMFQSSGVVVLSTANSGATWAKKQLATAGWSALQIQFVDANNGWANMFNPAAGIKLMRTTDAGVNWTTLSYPFVVTYSFADPLNGWAVTTWKNDTSSSVPTKWSIEKTSDGGQTWQRMYTDTAVNVMMLSSIKAVDASTCWVMGPTRTLLRTTNGGTSFTKKSLPTDFSYQSKHKNMYATDANNCWVSEDPEDNSLVCVIHHTSDGGQSWETQPSGISDGSLFYLFFLDNNHGWFSGETCNNCNDTTHNELARLGKTTNGGSTGLTAIKRNVNEINVYPNPGNGYFTIQCERPEMTRVDILNSRGEYIHRSDLKAGIEKLDVDLSGCSKGIYFLRIFMGDNTVCKTISVE